MNLVGHLMTRLLLSIGTKMFGQVDIYAPDGEDAPIRAITFSSDSAYIEAISQVEVKEKKENDNPKEEVKGKK